MRQGCQSSPRHCPCPFLAGCTECIRAVNPPLAIARALSLQDAQSASGLSDGGGAAVKVATETVGGDYKRGQRFKRVARLLLGGCAAVTAQACNVVVVWLTSLGRTGPPCPKWAVSGRHALQQRKGLTRLLFS